MCKFLKKRALSFALIFLIASVIIFNPAAFASTKNVATANVIAVSPGASSAQEGEILKNIAHSAYIYGYPLVASYAVMYSNVFRNGLAPSAYGFNQYSSEVRLMTPADRTIISPNADTPYGYVCFDLRTEPAVLTVPDIDIQRYFSVMFNDMYTFNFKYLGKRTTGNKGGKFLVAYKEEQVPKPLPDGIDAVIMSETPLVQALTRTQLFDQTPVELERVKKINSAIKVETFSEFLNQKPIPSLWMNFPVPSPKFEYFNTMEFYALLDFVLSLCPVVESEREMRESFRKVGINGDGLFSAEALTAAQKSALAGALKSGLSEIKSASTQMNFSNGTFFGSREKMREINGDSFWLRRAVGAYLGIYGNDIEEASYDGYYADVDGNELDGSKYNYSIRFDGKKPPPVGAFWSLTLYGEDKFFIENEINRYLINSLMIDDGSIVLEKDNSFTIYIQKDPPLDKRNWLPAPNGKFNLILRLYLPGEEILKGNWKAPSIVKSQK